jgi:hypothetical protein
MSFSPNFIIIFIDLLKYNWQIFFMGYLLHIVLWIKLLDADAIFIIFFIDLLKYNWGISFFGWLFGIVLWMKLPEAVPIFFD